MALWFVCWGVLSFAGSFLGGWVAFRKLAKNVPRIAESSETALQLSLRNQRAIMDLREDKAFERLRQSNFD